MKTTILCKCGEPLELYRVEKKVEHDSAECELVYYLLPCRNCCTDFEWRVRNALGVLMDATEKGKLAELCEAIETRNEEPEK